MDKEDTADEMINQLVDTMLTEYRADKPEELWELEQGRVEGLVLTAIITRATQGDLGAVAWLEDRHLMNLPRRTPDPRLAPIINLVPAQREDKEEDESKD